MQNANATRTAIAERLTTGLARAEAHFTSLNRRNTRFVWISLIAGGLATVIAAYASAIGPLLGPWKVTCGVVAALTATATVMTGVHKQLGMSDKLSRAATCAGKLDSLLVGLTVTQRDPEQIAAEYEEVVAQYREFVI